MGLNMSSRNERKNFKGQGKEKERFYSRGRLVTKLVKSMTDIRKYNRRENLVEKNGKEK